MNFKIQSIAPLRLQSLPGCSSSREGPVKGDLRPLRPCLALPPCRSTEQMLSPNVMQLACWHCNDVKSNSTVETGVVFLERDRGS